ncbi:MAG: SurA N-terminal domain-containing protein [Rhodobacteraceae bacterium]|nr:SurA N-terminal domain-containing protein [Paracoccaceae bacterium]
MAAGKSISKTFVWILLGLLIVGLAGFGATNMSGTIRTVGHAGDQSISVDAYARALQQEMRAFQAQTGQPVTMEQARALGLDRQVLAQLVALASLDHETDEIGLSLGDANLQREILSIPAFQGLDGTFDRESYRFALQNAGINETEFEEDLRAEAARSIVQGAISDGARMPGTLPDLIVEFIGARRDFTWAQLDEADLAAPLRQPDDAELRAYHAENIADYTLPETKQLTYALLTPEMILDTVEVDPALLRELYETRRESYEQPERRLVERLVFADRASADDASAQLSVGGTTFELLVQGRDLQLSDVDMGDVTRAALGEAGDAVFAATAGDVVGPLPSPLGPALYRVNGVLAAQSVSYEEALPELRAELARDRARRVIELQAESADDLLVGGATLEDLAQDTEMQLGTMEWTAQTTQGVAAYQGFREAAAAVTPDDYPEVAYLEDGGAFALRLDAVLPPRPEPFETARAAVLEDWLRASTETALVAQADALVARLSEGTDFAGTGLTARRETGVTRQSFIDGAPRTMISEVFEMAPGALRVIADNGAVYVLRLDATAPAETGGDMARLRAALGADLDQALSQALFQAFVADSQLRAEPQIDQRALNAVLTSFQ